MTKIDPSLAAARWLLIGMGVGVSSLMARHAEAEDITFEVQVPWCTPGGDQVLLRSNRTVPDRQEHDVLQQVGPDRWSGTFEVRTPRERFRYKYTHGRCDTSGCAGIEKPITFKGDGEELPPRSVPTGTSHVSDFVFVWRDAVEVFDNSGRRVRVRSEDEQVAFCHPYLSVSNVEGSAVTVGYDAYQAGTVELEWGEDTRYGHQLVRHGSFRNHFTLTDLVPGQTYHYRIVEDGFATADQTFRAPPAAGEPFRFAFMGDSQYYAEDNRLAHRAFVDLVSQFDPDLVVSSGDLVASERGSSGPGGWEYPERGRWNVFFSSAAPLLARAPFMTAMGNHEEDAPYFWSVFDFPTPDAPALDHYDFRFGQVHFVVLYTGTTQGYDLQGMLASQTPWMERTLAAAARDPRVRWQVVVLHRGPLSQGANHRDDATRFYDSRLPGGSSWRELWHQFGVDLVLAGHNHNFTLALDDGLRVVTSCSGAPVHPLFEPWSETTLWAEAACAANLFSVGRHTLSFEAQRVDGSPIEEARFTLCREDDDCRELPNPCPARVAWTCPAPEPDLSRPL